MYHENENDTFENVLPKYRITPEEELVINKAVIAYQIHKFKNRIVRDRNEKWSSEDYLEAYPEYLARELRQKILETDDNPFDSEYFTNIEHQDGREEPLREGLPCIIIATSGMLEGGPVLEYFRNIAPHKQNKILFVSYQVNGTLGRRVMDGARQVSISGKEGKIEVVSINCSTERLEGFSGHSDYNQLMAFIQRLRHKLRRVLVNHGEKKKSENLSMSIRRMYRISTHYPQIQEGIRLF